MAHADLHILLQSIEQYTHSYCRKMQLLLLIKPSFNGTVQRRTPPVDKRMSFMPPRKDVNLKHHEGDLTFQWKKLGYNCPTPSKQYVWSNILIKAQQELESSKLGTKTS